MNQNHITRRAFALRSIALTVLALSSFATVSAAEQQVQQPDGKPGNVKAVDSRDLWRGPNVSPANQGYHHSRNAETYPEVGLRLGWAMAELLKK